MNKINRAIACLMLAALAASCTVYRIKEFDGKTLAAKRPKGKIISVATAAGRVDFRENDPGLVKNDAIIGNIHATHTLDPYDIAEVTSIGQRTKVVSKDGDRFQVLASWRSGDSIICDVVRPKWIPLEEAVAVKVKSVNTAASILTSLGGIVLFVGALALDVATYGEDEYIDPEETFTGGLVSAVVDSWLEPGGNPRPPRSLDALSSLKNETNTAEETEFWIMEWTPVNVVPGEDGKFRVRLENGSGVPRGVDEAKLVVVDHAPGLVVAPDVRGGMGAFSNPVTPSAATDGDGQDITRLVRDKDGDFWRSPGGDSAADPVTRPRDEITLEFPRPKGARRAKLVVNATNSAWPAEFARQVLATSGEAAPGTKTTPVYQEWEFSKLRVRLLTAFGWQTGQVIFAGGPLPAEDMIYALDLDDVGTDKVWLKIAPACGYWLIDRLALDFSEDAPIEGVEVDAEAVDSPDAAEALKALAVEDGSTLFLGEAGSQSILTFSAPPLKEGMERTLFLRTVSCYEMPNDALATPPRRPGTPAR
jgi:hypothetical protein